LGADVGVDVGVDVATGTGLPYGTRRDGDRVPISSLVDGPDGHRRADGRRPGRRRGARGARGCRARSRVRHRRAAGGEGGRVTPPRHPTLGLTRDPPGPPAGAARGLPPPPPAPPRRGGGAARGTPATGGPVGTDDGPGAPGRTRRRDAAARAHRGTVPATVTEPRPGGKRLAGGAATPLSAR